MVSIAETCQTAICLSMILQEQCHTTLGYVTSQYCYIALHHILSRRSYQTQGLCMVSIAETCQTAFCLSVILQEVTSHNIIILHYVTAQLDSLTRLMVSVSETCQTAICLSVIFNQVSTKKSRHINVRLC